MNAINWNETYVNISPKLMGICRRYIKDLATAEDVVQDSFMVAMQKQNTLKDVNAINGWLSRIVINMALHHLKENKKIIFSTSENFEVADNSTIMSTNELNNKSRLLASDLDSNDVLEAIDGLPEHHKSVFNMYVIDKFSHSQISKTLEISVGTSKSHLSRARKSIQTFLLKKIENQPIDNEKKRRIAFFIFLGFGNSMLANFYRSKFTDFEIVAKNPFAWTKKTVAAPKQFIGLTKTISMAKLAGIGASFLMVSSVVFCYFTANSEIKTVPKNENNPKIIVVKKQNSINNQVVLAFVDTVKKAKNASKKELPKSKNKKLSTSKKTVLKPEQVAVLQKKDSAKAEVAKVVIIKKQIIKRDTIYVTK